MSFIDDLLAYTKSFVEEADEKAKSYGFYGKNGPLGSLGQQQFEMTNESDEGYEAKPKKSLPDPVPPPTAGWAGKNKKQRMYIRGDDGTFDLVEVELDDNGNPVRLTRPYRAPEGPINA
jgi:hypothetical protein